jgi:WhiB family redox-sensing transcriptional regulator
MTGRHVGNQHDAEIVADYRKGASLRDLAARYGMSMTSIQRHIDNYTTTHERPEQRASHAADTDAAWQSRGLCNDFDAETWFIDTLAHQAAYVCGACAVRQTCLQDALDTREPFGVRGGLTAPQRARLLTRMARESAAS